MVTGGSSVATISLIAHVRTEKSLEQVPEVAGRGALQFAAADKDF